MHTRVTVQDYKLPWVPGDRLLDLADHLLEYISGERIEKVDDRHVVRHFEHGSVCADELDLIAQQPTVPACQVRLRAIVKPRIEFYPDNAAEAVIGSSPDYRPPLTRTVVKKNIIRSYRAAPEDFTQRAPPDRSIPVQLGARSMQIPVTARCPKAMPTVIDIRQAFLQPHETPQAQSHDPTRRSSARLSVSPCSRQSPAQSHHDCSPLPTYSAPILPPPMPANPALNPGLILQQRDCNFLTASERRRFILGLVGPSIRFAEPFQCLPKPFLCYINLVLRFTDSILGFSDFLPAWPHQPPS